MIRTDDVKLLIIRELEGLAREIALFPDDQTLWQVVPGVSNSAGNLAMHVAGNLQHFIGASLGHTGYVRHREAEFSAQSGTRDQVTHELRAAIDAVSGSLNGLSEEALRGPMPGAPGGVVVSVERFLLHLIAHTAFHLGQAGYLRRTLAGSGAVSAHPLPVSALGGG
jgi:uncharacterized damage-inducible protein DinB